MTPTKSLVNIVMGNCNTLGAAIKTAGLQKILETSDPITVFAPSDAAFAAMREYVDYLLQPRHIAKLTKELAYHMVKGKYLAANLIYNETLSTIQGEKLSIQVKEGKITVDGAPLITADLGACNGVIHIIDKVLLPSIKTYNKNNNTLIDPQ